MGCRVGWAFRIRLYIYIYIIYIYIYVYVYIYIYIRAFGFVVSGFGEELGPERSSYRNF